jgi:hypothetical protein
MDDNRAAILRRRALFVGSALTAIGCTPQTKEGPTATTAPPSAPVVSVAAPATSPAPSATVVPEEPAPKVAGMPGYDKPEGLSEAANGNYDRLHKFMKESHAMLAPLAAKVPSCKLSGCEDDYRKAATVLTELTKDLRLFYICPGKSAEGQAFEPHKSAHMEFLRKRMGELDQRLSTASGNAEGWKALRSEIAMSKPTPCLSFACPDW